VWVSWTLADDGPPRLRSGETLATAAQALEGIPLAARLVNCSRPEAVDASGHPWVDSIRAALPDTVLSAKQFAGQVTVGMPSGYGAVKHELSAAEYYAEVVADVAPDESEDARRQARLGRARLN